MRTTRRLTGWGVLLTAVGCVGWAAMAAAVERDANASDSIVRYARSIELLEQRERELRSQLKVTRGARADAHRRTVTSGRAYVRLARAGLLPVGGGFEALMEHARRLERLRHGVLSASERERELAARQSLLHEQLADVRDELDGHGVHGKAIAQVRSALLAADERQRAFKRAFSDSPTSAHTAVYAANSGPADPSDVGEGFASMQGRLPFPVAGRSEIRAAKRETGGPGLEMQAVAGAPVRAVYPGRVAFADEYADYGRTVIIDHGGGYFSVSANLAKLDVQVGEEVSTGTPLGSVGPLDAGFGVYLEVRQRAQTLDPAEWFGI